MPLFVDPPASVTCIVKLYESPPDNELTTVIAPVLELIAKSLLVFPLVIANVKLFVFAEVLANRRAPLPLKKLPDGHPAAERPEEVRIRCAR